MQLSSEIRSGNRTALAKGLTLLESKLPEDHQAAIRLLEDLGRSSLSSRLVISGSPGVGKSTFIDRLGMRFLDHGHRLAVLTIDPSSSLSGGSILGDKTRMINLSQHPHAFVRPSPSGGHLGGVAATTYESTLLLEAAGFDFIMIETVGVGQSEIEARYLADVFITLVLPSAGDELQGLKKGILENTDLMVVHKNDGPLKKDAEITQKAYQSVWSTDHRKVLLCSSNENLGFQEIETEIKNLLVRTRNSYNRSQRDIYWFRERTKSELIQCLFKKHKDEFMRLEQKIGDGHQFYLRAVEELIEKLCC